MAFQHFTTDGTPNKGSKEQGPDISKPVSLHRESSSKGERGREGTVQGKGKEKGNCTHVIDIIPIIMPTLVPCLPGSAILAAHATCRLNIAPDVNPYANDQTITLPKVVAVVQQNPMMPENSTDKKSKLKCPNCRSAT